MDRKRDLHHKNKLTQLTPQPLSHAGRILNRFSRDMDIMDSTLPPTLIQLFGSLATYIAILSEWED